MEQSKQYQRLTKEGKAIISKFKKDRKKRELFNSIISVINKQNTINSRSVARSNFRGLLRTWFKFSNLEMKRIEATKEEKERYFRKLKETAEQKVEDTVDKALLKELLKNDICELLIKSGLRISELLQNKFRFTKTTVNFQLNKKENKTEYYNIHIIGGVKEWKDKFGAMREKYQNRTSKQIYDKLNRQLKGILPAHFSKKSSHICRAVYIRLIYKFKEGTFYGRWSLPRIIQTFLHHDNLSSTAYYQSVELSDDVENPAQVKEEPKNQH